VRAAKGPAAMTPEPMTPEPMTPEPMTVVRLKGPGLIEVMDEPRPEAGPGESLVRVGAVGLCGSDLHWFGQGGIGDALLSRPLVLGHEFGGTVEGGPLDGRRVAVDPAIPDFTCARCREGNTNLCPQVRFAGHGTTDGGLREYLTWPTNLLHPVPEDFSDATVAMLEPLGVALHCLDLGHVHLGNSVAVVGCGPIGLMLIHSLRVVGVSRVVAVEPLEHRRRAAARAGAELVLGPAEAAGHQGEVDISFEVAGTDDAVAISMQLVRAGGRLVLAGIPDDDRTAFPAALARRKGLTMAMARRMKEAYPRSISLVERGAVELDWLASASFSLADAAEAFAVAARREGLKILVQAG
jgi:L-iditol 2-dehydrogenase